MRKRIRNFNIVIKILTKLKDLFHDLQNEKLPKGREIKK